jgi:hypothetical protein
MLVLSNVGDVFRDDQDAAIRYRLPVGLRPLPGEDGTPQAVLSRSQDGGLLHLRLGAVWPEFAANERAVFFDEGRFRLLLQTPTAKETGQWRNTPVAGDAVVDRGVTLSPVEAAIARRLGERTGDLVDVEVELSVRGVAPSFPWLVSVPAETLRARIAALLGPVPATWDAVEAAFLGLGEETFTWYPLAPGAIRPPRDEALVAIARHVAPILLTTSDDKWALGEGGPARIDVSLNVPYVDFRRFGFRWSFSEFLASQTDIGRHLVDINEPGPFAAADISIVNDLPLAPGGIRSIAVEVRTGGPSGLLRHEFLPGQPAAARLRFVRETFETLQLQWAARITLMTAAGPAVESCDFRPCGQLLEINAATIGLKPLRFVAEGNIFDHATALEIKIGARTLTLTRASPQAWAVGRQPPPAAPVMAVLASGERHSLGTVPLASTGMTIGSGILGLGEMAPVLLRPPADIDRRAAYLAVQVDGQGWRTIHPGSDVEITVRRISRLQAPRLRYRTRHVPRDSSGTTRVMAESGWRDASGDTITVEL